MPGLLAHQYRAIRQIDRSLSDLRRAGIGVGIDAYDTLARIRSEVWRSIGLKQPKVTSLLLKLLGLSPGEIKIWHDAESGWISEARARPGAPPVYKSIPSDTAIKLLKGELTKKLEAELMTPDDYIGE